ncbi:MAG: ABC transporter permease [Actinomycetota bacterium]|nr:ABC transporter permease [Actinomycetota bacterium]
MATEKTTVYESDRALKISIVVQFQEMIGDLGSSRELIWRLFLREFTSRYKQSFLGLIWVIINPLATVGVFVYLSSAGILKIGDTGVPYVVYAVVGLTIWNLFASCVSACSGSVASAGAMIGKINFPKVSLVIAAALQSIVEFLVRLSLTLAVFILFGVVPSWKIIFLPLVLVPLFLMALGLGLFLALATVLIRDVSYVVSLATNFMMFLIPILYPPLKTGIIAKITTWNPFAQLIMAPRDLVLYGTFSNTTGWLWSTLLAVASFLFFWRVFHMAETKIAERI